jgi:hypothetical protein
LYRCYLVSDEAELLEDLGGLGAKPKEQAGFQRSRVLRISA